jgi:hypothetical protein
MGILQLIRIRGRAQRGGWPGLLLAGLGGAALVVALGQPFRLPSGQPGPGFVPALLAAALVGLGLLQAAGSGAGAPAAGGPRAGLALCGAIAAFALLLPWAGFLPACWAAGSLALAAAPLPPAAALAGGLVLAAVNAALFLGALGLSTPLIGGR